MSFEESIEKLKERHEALTQTVEIIASMQKETERRLQDVVGAVAALLQIVQSHERRLDNLDNPGNIPPSPN
jgi:archaellum component FlaC